MTTTRENNRLHGAPMIRTSGDDDGDHVNIGVDPMEPGFTVLVGPHPTKRGGGFPGSMAVARIDTAEAVDLAKFLANVPEDGDLMIVPSAETLVDDDPVFSDLVAIFQNAWEEADAEGLSGKRTAAGLRAVIDRLRQMRPEPATDIHAQEG